jgi:hypothetical protein
MSVPPDLEEFIRKAVAYLLSRVFDRRDPFPSGESERRGDDSTRMRVFD